MRPAKRTAEPRRRRRILLRPCRARDVEKVLDLWRRAAAEPSVTDDPDALRRKLDRDRSLFVLAWDRSRLLGSLIGGWDGWRGHMYRLAVDRACRRRGIARRLVKNVEARLRRLGAVRIDGIVVKRNRAGRVFWRELGYREHAEVARYVKDLRALPSRLPGLQISTSMRNAPMSLCTRARR